MQYIRLHRDGVDYLVTFTEMVEWDESREYTAIENKFYQVTLTLDKERSLWNRILPKEILKEGKFPYYAWEDKYETMANNVLDGYLMYGVYK